MTRLVEGVNRIVREVTSVMLFCMLGLVTIDVLARSIIGKTTLVSDEMSRYLLLAVVYLGLGLTQRAGRHIEVNVLKRWLPRQKRQRVEVAALVVGTLFVGYLTWLTAGTVVWNYVRDARSLTLVRTPLWIPHLFVPLGLAVFALNLVYDVIRRFTEPNGEFPQ